MNNHSEKLVIATRGSRLALWQARFVQELIRRIRPVWRTELLVLKTRGDALLDAPLSKLGGKGLFVKEIQDALLDGRARLAVHSIKDMPVELPAGLALGAIPQREAPEDVLLSCYYQGLNALPPGARVGTSSLRRQSQLLALRPDLRIISLRGNVDTRLRKLQAGDFEAIVMAAAGLRRLGLKAPLEETLPMELFLPAVGQGALGLEYVAQDTVLAQALTSLDHLPTRRQVEAERAFLAELEGGCQTPIAAHAAWINEDTLRLDGLVASADGTRLIRRQRCGAAKEPHNLGRALAKEIKNAGGAELLQSFTLETIS